MAARVSSVTRKSHMRRSRKRCHDRRGGRRVRSRRTPADADQQHHDDAHRSVSTSAEGRALFREYYARQRLLSNAEDWKAFGASMGSPLPVTFRMNRLPARRTS